MPTNLNLKIDAKKIDKTKLFVGEKGTYLDCVVIMHEEVDQYGNCGMIVQTWKDKPKDVKGNILGNAKWIQKKQQDAAPVDTTPAAADDLPF